MTRPSTWVAVLAALVVLAGASQLTRAGYSVDEEFTVFAVRGIAQGGLPHLPSSLLYDRGLAYSYASWVAGWLTGAELPAYRAVSLTSSLVSVLLVFAIVRRLTTDRAAMLAAVLVSVSMPFWATATTGRFYAPFLAVYLLGLHLFSRVHTQGITSRLLLGVLATAATGRWLHELAFTLVAIPVLCALVGPRVERRKWLVVAGVVVAGLAVAQATLFALHALEPSSGETMVRRFFLWQVVNLFETPPGRQYGVPLVVMILAWLIVPARASLVSVIALSGTAMILAFSLARASNVGPLTTESVQVVLSDGARYPLDMFWHVAAINPVATLLAFTLLAARLAGAGGEWRLRERGAHLLWIAWVLWFGAIDSGITANYLLLPVAFMLIAIAVDVDAIVSHALPPLSATSRRLAGVVVALAAVALAFDQWRGAGALIERFELARPTINIAGMDEVRAGIQPTDRIACTDELACLMLVGRIDRWLALDDFVRERFLVVRGGMQAGVYTGVPAAFRPGELFAPNPDGTLPDRVIVVDVFKDFPIGSSRAWLPRAIELDGLQVTPLLETPQGRVLQISPPERNARRPRFPAHAALD